MLRNLLRLEGIEVVGEGQQHMLVRGWLQQTLTTTINLSLPVDHVFTLPEMQSSKFGCVRRGFSRMSYCGI